jgi:hypothetical protein
MGFLTGLLSATVKTVLTPIAAIKDVKNVLDGEPAEATKELLGSAVNDVEDAFDDLGDGSIL